MKWPFRRRRQLPLDRTGPATSYPDHAGAWATDTKPDADDTAILPVTTLGEQHRGGGR